jgi:hypothetical protein
MPRLHLTAIFVATFFCSSLATAQTIQVSRDNKTIAINTTDEATAPADVAAITIGFEIFKATSDSASAEGGRLSHAIMEAIHKAGVEDKSIESGFQGVSRNMQFDEKESADQRAERQYRFTQNWTVTTTPADAPKVLQLALAAGANQSGNIEWRLADRKGLQAKAAASALMKARAVASQMAEGLQVKLGPLIYASNEVPETRVPLPVARFKGQTMMSTMAAPPPPPTLELRPQTIHENATVYAVFSIE